MRKKKTKAYPFYSNQSKYHGTKKRPSGRFAFFIKVCLNTYVFEVIFSI